MATARVRDIDLGSITLSVTTAGEGPTVLLLHGFPEIAYSWRHQVDALADAGYSVIAPDQRGYGWSDCPDDVASYSMFDLVGDAIALLDYFEVEQAVVVGHDWGSFVASHVALFRPDRVRGVCLMSVPYQPRGDLSIVERIRTTDPEGPFGYMLAFQEEGIPELLLDPDPGGSLRNIHWKTCGQWADVDPGDGSVPDGLPDHLSEAELENYARAFARSGFRGGANYYRNFQYNFDNTAPWHGAQIIPPTLFVAGDRDFVVAEGDGAMGSTVESMAASCRDFRGVSVAAGAGHWVQQEAPQHVSQALIDFASSLD